MKYNLAFKYRIYPNKEQELLINNIQNKYNFYNPAPNSNPFPE